MVERVDPRIENHRRSILALHALLTDLSAKAPEVVRSESVAQVLISQGGLARFKDEAKNISGMSLNTAKRIADAIVPGGFGSLDRLRRHCLALVNQKVEPQRPGGYGTKEELKQQKEALELEIGVLRQDLLICTKVVELSFQQGRRYAKEAGAGVEALCRKEQRELFAYLSSCSGDVEQGMESHAQALSPDRT